MRTKVFKDMSPSVKTFLGLTYELGLTYKFLHETLTFYRQRFLGNYSFCAFQIPK